MRFEIISMIQIEFGNNGPRYIYLLNEAKKLKKQQQKQASKQIKNNPANTQRSSNIDINFITSVNVISILKDHR